MAGQQPCRRQADQHPGDQQHRPGEPPHAGIERDDVEPRQSGGATVQEQTDARVGQLRPHDGARGGKRHRRFRPRVPKPLRAGERRGHLNQPTNHE